METFEMESVITGAVLTESLASMAHARFQPVELARRRRAARRACRMDSATAARATEIARVIVARSRCTLAQICKHDRSQYISGIRNMVMYFVRKLTSLSYPTIGYLLNRDHATVMHGCKRIAARAAKSPAFALVLAEIEATVMAAEVVQ